MTDSAPSLSARTILAASGYVLVVGGVAVALAATGHPELMFGWFGFASIGGLGSTIKSQLTDVARTVGTQHLENGTSLAVLEKYTHDSIHDIKNELTSIKGLLQLSGAVPMRPPKKG